MPPVSIEGMHSVQAFVFIAHKQSVVMGKIVLPLMAYCIL